MRAHCVDTRDGQRLAPAAPLTVTNWFYFCQRARSRWCPPRCLWALFCVCTLLCAYVHSRDKRKTHTKTHAVVRAIVLACGHMSDFNDVKTKIRYKFDTYIAKGGISIFTSLAAVFLILLVVIGLLRGLLFLVAGEHIALQYEDLGFFGNVYLTFLAITDPGNMAQDILSSPWYKIFAIVAGMSGVVIFSALIAFITTALDQKMKDLKRGHSQVLESGHTLILGWNEQRIIEILKELVIANESESDATVVILAPHDKEEMDTILQLQFPQKSTLRIVTRSGSTSSLKNLQIVAASQAKSVIVLATCDETASSSLQEISDATSIQTILAFTSMKETVERSIPVIAEIHNQTYRDVVRQQFGTQVIAMDANETLAKILVQTSRSVGLSLVYGELLSFAGCEIYTYQASWGNVTVGEAAFRFEDGILIGVMTARGGVELNPPVDRPLQQGDRVLLVANDDSTIQYRAQAVVQPEEIPFVHIQHDQRVEKELILGWTKKAPAIIREYNDYVRRGSVIDVMLHEPTVRMVAEIGALNESLQNVEVRVIEKHRLRFDDLVSIDPFTYDNIIILADHSRGEYVSADDQEDDMPEQRIDSENIVVLLLLRQIFSAHEAAHPDTPVQTKLITEVVDSQNQALVAKAGVKDMIISNQLMSMIFAQLSENGSMKSVYDDLFSEEGSEIYIKSFSLYTNVPGGGLHTSFASLMRIAARRGEVCLGVKLASQEADKSNNFGVHLNPDKTTQYRLGPEDGLIVLAHDER